MNYERYYTDVVRSAKNDLHNPRISFNWGFHDGKSDLENGRPIRDVSDHQNPYYAQGYLIAQRPSIRTCHDSSFPWIFFLENLAREDYINTACSVLESNIRGQEYLFANKHDRTGLSDSTWNSIILQYDKTLHATTVKQSEIKHAILKRFGLI